MHDECGYNNWVYKRTGGRKRIGEKGKFIRLAKARIFFKGLGFVSFFYFMELRVIVFFIGWIGFCCIHFLEPREREREREGLAGFERDKEGTPFAFC